MFTQHRPNRQAQSWTLMWITFHELDQVACYDRRNQGKGQWMRILAVFLGILSWEIAVSTVVKLQRLTTYQVEGRSQR
jgi:hypothetical protein